MESSKKEKFHVSLAVDKGLGKGREYGIESGPRYAVYGEDALMVKNKLGLRVSQRPLSTPTCLVRMNNYLSKVRVAAYPILLTITMNIW